MTNIKLCGMSRPCDIEAANALAVAYIGFVFARKSKRHVSIETAAALRRMLSPEIKAVGVFVDEEPEQVARLLKEGVIDIAQLHGREDEGYIRHLRTLTAGPLIQAFRMDSAEDLRRAVESSADLILLDSGSGGTGTAFDWTLLGDIRRPYILAGGLNPCNVSEAVRRLRPWAVDVSSGIETNGQKDAAKMAAFVAAVRKEDSL